MPARKKATKKTRSRPPTKGGWPAKPQQAADTDDLAALTAAPVPFEWRGGTYRLSPMRMRDTAELSRFIVMEIKRQYRNFKAHLDACEAPREHYAQLKDELEAALARPLSSDFVTDPEPWAFRAWLMLKRCHPDLSIAAARQMVHDVAEGGADAFNAAFTELNGQRLASQEKAKNV